MPYSLDVNEGLDRIFSQWLTAQGYGVDPAMSGEDKIRLFFSLSRRLIEQTPKSINRSVELNAQTLEPGIKQGMENVLSAIAAGLDLKPYMSKNLDNAEYQDGLLNDWGVHHFHLGAKSPEGSIGRTNELLFGMVLKPSTFYALLVGAHGSFEDRRLIEIFIDNWPTVADKWRLRGFQAGSNPTPTAAQIKDGRKGINFMVEHNGNIYAPPGGGINTAGTSMNDVSEADRLFSALKPLHQTIQNAEKAIRKDMQNRRFSVPRTLKLRMINLIFYPVEVYFEETVTKYRFGLSLP